MPKDAQRPVAPPVMANEEARYIRAEEAVKSACWTASDRRIIAMKEQGDLSDAEIGKRVGKSSTQVNRAWHGVLQRAEEALALDGDDAKYRKCHRRKRHRDAPAHRNGGRDPLWSVAWVSFHGNRLPDDPLPDATGLFDEDGYKLGPLPRC